MRVAEIKALIRQHRLGISPHRLGQHFLVEARARERIGRALEVGPADRILEIGAGLGSLTEILLETGARVTGVERDARFFRVLEERFRDHPRLTLIRSDIRRVELSDHAAGRERSLTVFGNIPYALTSPILEYLLRQRRWVRRAVLTVQKEVALRLVASAGGKTYSSFSVMVQIAFRPKVAFLIPPNAFYPQPRVTSAVLRLDPLPDRRLPAEEEEALLMFVRSIFTHRRKTLVNALITAGAGRDREAALSAVRAAGLEPSARPETLDLPALIRLHRALR